MTNNRTGKVYVGQSNNLTRRKQEHMSKLSKGTHHNKQMQQDFNRGDRFSFQVVEYVNGTRDDLNSREKSQIRNHNSFHGGYNRTSGGDYIPSNKGYHRSRKKYPIGTYSNDDTFGGKCFVGILIALIILFFLSYWPMHFLYGILIIIAVVIVFLVCFGIYSILDSTPKMENVRYCYTCEKNTKINDDGFCSICGNLHTTEYYKEKQHKRLGEEKSPYKRCPECNKLVSKTLDTCKYCNYYFKHD